MTEARESPPRRCRGTREDTEKALCDAMLRLLERDGVLAGITLRQVAQEAGVNHGQAYQYFGTRQVLLRSAIGRVIEQDHPDPERHWDQPFAERRREMWQRALRQRDFVKLEALLALDGDPEFSLFRAIERTRTALERDRKTGALPADADAEVMHALSVATYLGYGIFRETMARDLGITPAELDERAGDVYDHMLNALQHSDTKPNPARGTSDSTGD